MPEKDDIQRQIQRADINEPVAGGGGTIFTEPVLVVNEKAKLVEITAQYSVYDQNGTQIGVVEEVGQSKAKKALRALTRMGNFMTHRLEISDMGGNKLLELTRPRKVMKSTVHVADAKGNEIGKIVQENLVGKIRFGLEAGDRKLGSINAENWRAWDFSVKDETETEVARITKTWQGLAKAAFTSAENFVVQIHRPLDEPLRSLVVAAALGVNTSLKREE